MSALRGLKTLGRIATGFTVVGRVVRLGAGIHSAKKRLSSAERYMRRNRTPDSGTSAGLNTEQKTARNTNSGKGMTARYMRRFR